MHYVTGTMHGVLIKGDVLISGVSLYIEGFYCNYTMTFTAWAKFYFAKYSCNAKVDWLGKSFVQRKFPAVQYHSWSMKCSNNVIYTIICDVSVI